ncbi:hypothetical protein CDAR_120231 [Caerostris darwini]|uniref:Uncharacterized protein n=1 Tax=Caerostris darwini TaxID=1538125 RepID=A0AAV4UPK7_9ARAC|nr:hypothetical protein CDAR_120231 [Caerostris darwini]
MASFPGFLRRKKLPFTSGRWFYGQKNGLVALMHKIKCAFSFSLDDYSLHEKKNLQIPPSIAFSTEPGTLSGWQIRQKPCTSDNHWKKQERGEGGIFPGKSCEGVVPENGSFSRISPSEALHLTSGRWFYGQKNGPMAICYSSMSKVSTIFTDVCRVF